MSTKQKKRDPKLETKLAELKQKQDLWMKQRSSTSTSKSHKKDNPHSPRRERSVKKTPQNAQNTKALLWNTGASNSYSGFVVRKRETPGKLSGSATNRSHNSVISHSSLKGLTRPGTAKSEKFIKRNSIENYNNNVMNDEILDGEKVNLNQKMSDYFSKLGFVDNGHTNELESTINVPNSLLFDFSVGDTMAIDLTNKEETIKNHYCALCQQLMISRRNTPQILRPCGHSFCFTCLSGVKFCPSCQSVITGMQENHTLASVIQEFYEHKEKKELEKKEAEAQKYFDEYKSLSTRTDVMKAEATSIIDSMEQITHKLVEKKNSVKLIEEDAVRIKQKIKSLHKELQSLEKCHNNQAGSVDSLENEYQSQKTQLLLVERTLKTLKNSKERVKAMMENLVPSLRDDLSE